MHVQRVEPGAEDPLFNATLQDVFKAAENTNASDTVFGTSTNASILKANGQTADAVSTAKTAAETAYTTAQTNATTAHTHITAVETALSNAWQTTAKRQRRN